MAEGGRNLRIKPFTVDEDHIATGEKWDDWLEELEREMRIFRISDAAEGDVYVKLQCKLNSYFASKKNIHYARYLFLKMKPHAGEGTVS